VLDEETTVIFSPTLTVVGEAVIEHSEIADINATPNTLTMNSKDTNIENIFFIIITIVVTR
jgi:hypothetical protein